MLLMRSTGKEAPSTVFDLCSSPDSIRAMSNMNNSYSAIESERVVDSRAYADNELNLQGNPYRVRCAAM